MRITDRITKIGQMESDTFQRSLLYLQIAVRLGCLIEGKNSGYYSPKMDEWAHDALDQIADKVRAKTAAQSARDAGLPEHFCRDLEGKA